MKIWTSDHTFEHPWDTVVQAAWRKYPNPMNPSVVGVDVINREMNTDGILRSQRLLHTEWGLPAWVIRIVGLDKACLVSEHSEVDAKKRTMTLRSRNLTFCNIVSIDEQLVYSPHPTKPKSTLLAQETTINVTGLPMSSLYESIITGTAASKAQCGRQAMEWVIDHIKGEAIDISRAAKEEINSLSQNFTSAARSSTL